MTLRTGLGSTARHPRVRRALLLASVLVVPMTAMITGEHAAAAAVPAAAVTAPPVNTSTDLGAIGYGQVLVDNANRHVLVSGPTGNVVDVLNYRGTVVKVLSGLPGASGMVTHGGTLYIALSTNGTIVKTSLATLAKPVIVASGLLQPTVLAWAGGRIWATLATGALAAITPATGRVSLFGAFYEPTLATSPALPNTLFVAETGLSPGSITELNVGGATPTVALRNGFTDQENIGSLAVSPDGTRVIPAAGATLNLGYVYEELSATTLTADGLIYPGAPYPGTVTVSPGGGGIVATGLSENFFAPSVSVEHLGNPIPYFTANPVNVLGLALTGTGSRLFAATVGGATSVNTIIYGYALP